MNMKKVASLRVISLVAVLLTLASIAAGCSFMQPAPVLTPTPTLPIPQATQPPVASENQSATEPQAPAETTTDEVWYPVADFSDTVGLSTPPFHIYGTAWRLKWTIDAEDLQTAVFNLAIYPKASPFMQWQTVSSKGSGNGTVDYFMSNPDQRDFFIKVTALNLRGWSVDIEDNATAATSFPVEISSIHWKGTYYPPDPAAGFCYERVEPDEYVVIKNLSSCFVDLTGWTLKNISKPSPTFKFPEATIVPGGVIRVYTDVYIPKFLGFTFYYGHGDLWSNDNPDIAVLSDSFGNEVSRKSYSIPIPLNQAAE